MKRVISIILAVFGLVGVSSAITMEYRPSLDTSQKAPYDWTNAALWFSNKYYTAACNFLPTTSDGTWLVDSCQRDASTPLTISSGTAAKTSTFYLGNNSSSSNPVNLIVDGGSMENAGEAYYGQKSAGQLTIRNGGSVTADKKAWIGTAASSGYKTTFNAGVNVEDATSSLTVKGGLFIGNQLGGLSRLENHGTVNLLGTASSTVDYQGVFLGYSPARRTLGKILSVIDNYGTLTATADHRYYLGGTAGQTGLVTNHVGATISKAYVISVGSCTNATGTLVNEGTVNVSRLYVGGDNFNSYTCGTNALAASTGFVTNSGTLTCSSLFRIGYAARARGVLENTGVITAAHEIVIGYQPNSTGIVRHVAGTFAQTHATQHIYIGYLGNGTLELAGDTRTDIHSSDFQVASGGSSRGTLIVRDRAELDFGGNQLKAAVDGVSTAANVSIGDDAKVSNIGVFRYGSRDGNSTFEVKDRATVANIEDFRMYDNRTVAPTGTATFRVSGNACVTNVAHVRLGTNVYNNTVLEIADNGYFALPDDASSSNNIEMSTNGKQLGNGLIRLRGGRIGLGNKGGLWLGANTTKNNPGCTARVQGYGSFTNQGSGEIWSNLGLRSGCVVADGEGIERDLDMSTFGVIVGASDREYLNCSGTNGWYATNKGRLLYPLRDCETTSSTIGDYGRLTNDVPKFVNSAQFLFRDASGAQITSKRRYIAELYAPDRTDIPEGLRADADEGYRVRRLGIWRAGVNRYMKATESTRVDFKTAEMKVRYNNWPMEELKDGAGNLPSSLRIGLFAHDGSATGKWRCLKSVPASTAADSNYLIEGTVGESAGVYNIGWFAVVAYEPDGMTVIVK